MRWFVKRRKFISSWSIAPMESFLKGLSRMALWEKNKLQRFSSRFSQPCSIWSVWECHTGISNQKIYFLMDSGMQNWLILASAAKALQRMKKWERLYAERHHILLLKCFSKLNTQQNWWMCGPWGSLFTPCWQLKCPLRENHHRKEDQRSSIVAGYLKISSVSAYRNFWVEFS